jgi:hypothetical protein
VLFHAEAFCAVVRSVAGSTAGTAVQHVWRQYNVADTQSASSKQSAVEFVDHSVARVAKMLGDQCTLGQ